MVVGDAYALSGREETAETYCLRSTPHLVDNAAGILEGELFLIELRPLTAHHVEQDAITGCIALDMRIGSPVLGTEGPCFTTIGAAVPLRRPPVLGIEADEVDSE